MNHDALPPEMRAVLEREKLEAMAEFAAGAGHEINNPVATIVGRAQLLLAHESDPDRRQQLLTIVAQALRIRDMIGDAMLFARPPEPRRAPCDLCDLVREESERLLEAAAARSTSLTLDLVPPAPILADRTQIAVVLHALVRNSLEALRTGGTVTIRVAVEPDDDAPAPIDVSPIAIGAATSDGEATADGAASSAWVVLRVIDDGPGFVEHERHRLFDPFYSGRQAGRGLGFGLPKSWRIVRLHEGTIDAVSQPGRTEFVVRLPLAAPLNA